MIATLNSFGSCLKIIDTFRIRSNRARLQLVGELYIGDYEKVLGQQEEVPRQASHFGDRAGDDPQNSLAPSAGRHRCPYRSPPNNPA